MDWLNYHHLKYFWAVAREGSITRACEKLRLSQPAISGQIKQLEESLGGELFVRTGRGLSMTDLGRAVFGYADEIFRLGEELQDVARGRAVARPVRIHAGITDTMPKLIAHRILEPLLSATENVRLTCQEDSAAALAAELARGALDLVLSDAPLPAEIRVKAYTHELGSCGVSFFAVKPLARKLKAGFPGSLQGAPTLLPLEGSALRRGLDRWFQRIRVQPAIVGEFKDSALMKTFGQGGAGAFPAPSVIEAEIRRIYGVERVGEAEGVEERFYAISLERKLRDPVAVRLAQAAHQGLFAGLHPAGKESGGG